MNNLSLYFGLVFSGILIKNVLLSQFLGICSFLGVSKKTSSAVGMGMAVTVVLVVATIASYAFYYLVQVPFHLEFLRTISFIIIIAAIVQLIEVVMKKYMRGLYESLGVYLPLITTNCAVLGIAILNINNGYDFLGSILYALGSGLGFLLVIVLFSAIREKLELLDIPEAFKGLPIALITAAFMSLAFIGFGGIL
ncbi:MAG: electron transport complex protein RnfA [Fusobacteria bacterium]|nr:MAG: electron transport complex protein RnfA [Fusobacteriota bacterium]KAF0229660.1 MAG: electron transport complex protein [Fusobacteriota bacterium]